MTSAFFRKLSLRAEQSWHQNSGAKRRDDMRSLNMSLPLEPRAPVCCADGRDASKSARYNDGQAAGGATANRSGRLNNPRRCHR